MNDLELFKNVEEMRRWQREYFRTRSQKALRYAKDYERRVDRELDRRRKCREAPGLFRERGPR